MSREYRQLATSLKQLLKSRRLTYRDVAQKLDVSEQTIKRLLSADDGHVGRMASICDFLGVSFFDLARLAGEDREETFRLSTEQEEHFCAHPEDYGFFDALLRRQSVSSIAAKFSLKARHVQSILRRLERTGVLERAAGNEVKLLVRGTHNWIDGGPLQERFLGDETSAFIKSAMARISDLNVFTTSSERRVSAENLRDMVSEMKNLFVGYRRRAQTEEALLPADQLIEVRWTCGIAPWPASFEQYLRMSAAAEEQRKNPHCTAAT